MDGYGRSASPAESQLSSASRARNAGFPQAVPASAEEKNAGESKLGPEQDEVTNPFSLPPDDQVFLVRDRERQEKRQRRERMKHLSVYEKAAAASRGTSLRATVAAVPQNTSVVSKQNHKTRGLVAAATAAISKDRRRGDKEVMADFIAKKREMFLVQMSLDTKREEIRKLEEKAQMKEEALKKSELMLEEDALRFDTFLKENDKKAHDAIKRAEAETKAKQDKVQEIKKLNQQIQLVQSDMSKLKEQLEDCMKYKEFLDKLTPPEYFERQLDIKQKRKQDRRDARRKVAMEEYEKRVEETKARYEAAKAEEEARLKRQGSSAKKKKLPGPKVELRLPPAPDFEDDVSESSGEEIPMYFTEPQQLLDIFTQLEESNLFLIQNSQETEQALEELKQEFRETKRRMDSKTRSLKSNIDDLQQQIFTEEAKANSLRERMQVSTGEDIQEALLVQLNERVKDVYRRCGFDAEATPATLTMLTDLEARLEELLGKIEKMPEEYVIKAEKMKEKDRRERVRAERLDQQKLQYEERLRKSMARSMQAPKKKTGKTVMFRSAPPNRGRAKRESKESKDNEEDTDQEFFSW